MKNISIKKELLGYVNANYTVIDVLSDYVIAQNDNAPCKYVVWLYDVYPATNGGYKFDFYYGHYYTEYGDALQDFISRVTDNVAEV